MPMSLYPLVTFFDGSSMISFFSLHSLLLAVGAFSYYHLFLLSPPLSLDLMVSLLHKGYHYWQFVCFQSRTRTVGLGVFWIGL